MVLAKIRIFRTDLRFSIFSDIGSYSKGRTIGKVKGGGNQKKIHARENAKKKNSCKEEGKEKKFMEKEGPIVTFSESLSFKNQQYYQAQYE